MNFNQIILQKVTKAIALVIFCLLQKDINSQVNLVNNNSFELSPSCKVSDNPTFWYQPCKFDANYFNSCYNGVCGIVPKTCCTGTINYQFARSGNAYIGLFFSFGTIGINRRRYQQTKLDDSLKKGKRYYIEFFVNNCAGSNYACNNISALLTKTAVYVDTIATPYGVLPATAQIYNYGNPIIYDTLNWVKVSSIYKALGGEQFLTLGNFKNDNQTNYNYVSTVLFNSAAYNIDDVSVYEINDSFCLKADAGRDTTIKIGDSVFIGSYTNGIDTLRWLNANTNTVIDSTQPGFWVKPTANTTYILYQIVNSCPSSDTVTLVVQPLPLKFTKYDVRCMNLGCGSSPRGNERSVENTWTTANEINVSHFNIQRSIDGIHFETIGKVVAKNNSLNDYIFTDEQTRNEKLETWYYRLQSVDKDGKVNYSEIKKLEIRNSKSEINIYPNPTNDFINIQSKELIKEIKIINQLGQVIYYKNNINSTNIKISTNEFAKGLYIINVLNENIKLLLE